MIFGARKSMIRDINEIRECPDCASTNIVHNQDREQVICRECGLIFEPLAPAMEKAFEKTHQIEIVQLTSTKKKKAKKKAVKKKVKTVKKAKKPVKRTKRKTTKKKRR